MKNFDRFIAIDWSGAKSPVRNNAISVAEAMPGRTAPRLVGPDDRRPWSREAVAAWILSLAAQNMRTIIGIDCNFAYGEETGFAQFGEGYIAFDLWDAVEDACSGDGNFFGGGYVDHALHGRHYWRRGARPDGFALSPRLTERECKRLGHGHPESPFKLIGAKQVGMGGLAGMRLLRYLRREGGGKIAVWPFDENVDGAAIVIAEIYPRLFLRHAGHGNGKIARDDVPALNRVLAHFDSAPYEGTVLSDHDSDALVSASGLRYSCGNAKTVPENYAKPEAPHGVLMREGWIFGVAPNMRGPNLREKG